MADPLTTEELLELAGQLAIIAGRISGFIVTDGPPSNTLGAIGAVAFDQVTRTWYGPKTASGWPPGVVVTQGPQGDSAKQAVINAGELASGASDADFAAWLADAQIEAVEGAVQPLVDAADASATAAAGSATAAAGSATSASGSATTATTKAGEASASATAAAGSATDADASATAAATAQTGAETAQGLAEDARDAADASATAAAASATAAGGSASTAEGHADDAAASATSAAGSAATATTKAGEASDARDDALAAQTAAETAQTAAAGSATTASGFADDAEASATAAAGSASDAATARTGAETAQTAAEAAQAAAEAARDEAGEIVGGDFVTGPESSTVGYIPTFTTTSGKSIGTGRPIGVDSGSAVPDRDAADTRFRRISVAIAQSDITGLIDALAAKATPADITAAISDLVDGAPTALDTLKELADALEDQDDALAALLTAVDGKQPVSATLTALAGLTTTSFGRGLLELSNVAALRTALALAISDVSGLQTALDAKQATMTKAAGSDLRALTDDAKYLTAKSVADAAALVTLTDASTIAVDMAAGANFTVTLGGNRTLGAPSNAKPGMTGTIMIKQPSSGGPRTLAYASAWLPFGSTPAVSTAANAVDLLTYFVEASGKIRFSLSKGGAA